MNTVAKKCTGPCKKVLPMCDYRYRSDRMLYESACLECESERNAAKWKRANTWSDDDLAIVSEHYPLAGVAGCKPLLAHRSNSSIIQAAKRLNVSYVGPRICGSKPKETEWAVPMHEYGPCDMALRAWRVSSIAPVSRQPLRCAL